MNIVRRGNYKKNIKNYKLRDFYDYYNKKLVIRVNNYINYNIKPLNYNYNCYFFNIDILIWAFIDHS